MKKILDIFTHIRGEQTQRTHNNHERCYATKLELSLLPERDS